MKKRFFSLALIALVSSCTSRPAGPPPSPPADTVTEQPPVTGTVLPALATHGEPAQTYALYLPASCAGPGHHPVMVFADPHGDGSLPLNMYKELAEQFGIVLIGSNACRNGLSFDQTNSLVDGLIREATARYGGEAAGISLAGFSGGAKVVLVAAPQHPGLNAVVYCGATVPSDAIGPLPPSLAFAGTRDMNYAEMILASEWMQQKGQEHALVEWDGKHEWPVAGTFEDAFYWCYFKQVRHQKATPDPERLRRFGERMLLRTKHHPAPLALAETCRNAILFLDGIGDVTSWRQQLQAVTGSEAFRREVQEQQAALQTEATLKANYAQCFNDKGLTWWDQEIRRMRRVRGDQQVINDRLLGYLSLAAYTYSNRAIQNKDYASAQRFLAIYKLADPTNSEQPFLMACLLAQTGRGQEAIASLQESVRMGMKDRMKLESEASFSSLKNDTAFQRIVQAL